jgi:hypothetical protein
VGQPLKGVYARCTPLGAIEYDVMAFESRKKGRALLIRSKFATDTLLDTMRDVIEDGARGMTPKERQESEKKFNAALDRSVAARERGCEPAYSKPHRVVS